MHTRKVQVETYEDIVKETVNQFPQLNGSCIHLKYYDQEADLNIDLISTDDLFNNIKVTVFTKNKKQGNVLIQKKLHELFNIQ